MYIERLIPLGNHGVYIERLIPLGNHGPSCLIRSPHGCFSVLLGQMAHLRIVRENVLFGVLTIFQVPAAIFPTLNPQSMVYGSQ